MADDGYLIGFEDSSGNFVEVGRFNNLSGNTSDPVFIEHAGSGTRMELDGSGFDMNGSDITNAGTVNTDEMFSDPAGAVLTQSTAQTISDGSITKVSWDSASERNTQADDFADLPNDAITIPNNDYSYAKVTCQVTFSTAVEIDLLWQRLNGSGFTGSGRIILDSGTGILKDGIQTHSAWVPVSSGDSFTIGVRQQSGSNADTDPSLSSTWLSLDAI